MLDLEWQLYNVAHKIILDNLSDLSLFVYVHVYFLPLKVCETVLLSFRCNIIEYQRFRSNWLDFHSFYSNYMYINTDYSYSFLIESITCSCLRSLQTVFFIYLAAKKIVTYSLVFVATVFLCDQPTTPTFNGNIEIWIYMEFLMHSTCIYRVTQNRGDVLTNKQTGCDWESSLCGASSGSTQ